jgi:hypothetical protein
MRYLLLLFILTFSLFGEVARLVNLDLYTNDNPSVLTDLRGDKDHVSVLTNAIYKDTLSEVTSVAQQQTYEVDVKYFYRSEHIVFYINGLVEYFGVITDPTETNPDRETQKTLLDVGFAAAMTSDSDLGISYSIAHEDYNTTTANIQIGMRKMLDRYYGITLGMQSYKTDTEAANLRPYAKIGLSSSDDEDIFYDIAASYKFSTPTQSEVIEAYGQVQSDDFLENRLGFRYDFSHAFAISSTDNDIISHKYRIHTSMESGREENTFVSYFFSYKNESIATNTSHAFELGVVLRGYY